MITDSIIMHNAQCDMYVAMVASMQHYINKLYSVCLQVHMPIWSASNISC